MGKRIETTLIVAAGGVGVSGGVGTFSVVKSSRPASVCVSAVSAFSDVAGRVSQDSWWSIVANPGDCPWSPVPATRPQWDALTPGTVLAASRGDGVNEFTDLAVFVVNDAGDVDSAGQTSGADSLWYWDYWTLV